jgi:hypothetical protein
MESAASISPVLVYYDQHKPVTLQVDASEIGLGSVLIQEGMHMHLSHLHKLKLIMPK